jgi:FKBP-type peptidyl-prolyl cis-trans isomerase SlyD
MRIGGQCIVTLKYSLRLGDGQVVESSGTGEPLVYLHGSGQIMPGLERQLEGMEVGESRQLTVSPAEGYGERDEQKMQQVPRSVFGDKPIGVGDELIAVDEEQNQIPVRIDKMEGDQVTVDFNHPLAGKTLHFDVTVEEVREATAEERSHGHVHGPGQVHVH